MKCYWCSKEFKSDVFFCCSRKCSIAHRRYLSSHPWALRQHLRLDAEVAMMAWEGSLRCHPRDKRFIWGTEKEKDARWAEAVFEGRCI
jgi:hypothetical protein